MRVHFTAKVDPFLDYVDQNSGHIINPIFVNTTIHTSNIEGGVIRGILKHGKILIEVLHIISFFFILVPNFCNVFIVF